MHKLCILMHAALALAASPAAADVLEFRRVPCTDHGTARGLLEEHRSETPVSIALEHRGILVEVFAAESGTWSLVITDAEGHSCLLLQGTAYESLEPRPQLGTPEEMH